ncbi:Uncharacterised protein [Actinomadura madurae]|nr:Uncharacterised protein [Actinomadura madurae]
MPELPETDYSEVDPANQDSDAGEQLTTPPEQDLNEKGRSKWEQLEQIKTGLDAVGKVVKGADDFRKQPKPTGQAEVNTRSSMHPPHEKPTNPADFVTNSVIAGAVLIGGTIQVYRKLTESKEENRVHN